MARSIENTLTTAGLNLMARSLAEGKPVIFSRAALGTGVAPDADDISHYTALITPYDNGVISNRKVNSAGNLIVTVTFVNTSVQESTYIDEIGLFCKLDGDASDVLFSYLTFGQFPDLILAAAEASVQRTYDLPYIFGSGATASVVIDPSAMVSEEDVSTTATAGKLLRVNQDGKLDVSITGDALTLGGHSYTYFAPASHRHDNATTSADGFMSKEDKAAHDLLVSRVNQEVNTDSIPTFAGAVVNGYIDNARFR